MIDRITVTIPNAESGFTLIFLATPFPGHQFRLDWRRAEDEGNWYYSATLIWKDGCALPLCCTSRRLRRAFTFRCEVEPAASYPDFSFEGSEIVSFLNP